VKDARTVTILKVSSIWAVLWLVALSTLVAILALVGQAVPDDVSEEPGVVAFSCHENGTGLI
jgi:hypothetical protein